MICLAAAYELVASAYDGVVCAADDAAEYDICCCGPYYVTHTAADKTPGSIDGILAATANKTGAGSISLTAENNSIMNRIPSSPDDAAAACHGIARSATD